ncbi:MAG: hypothetical protein M3137_01925 [Actinomycetota bacterium]|nr:hypothetical protein [Actinomycetota bacterium]
MNDRLPHGGPAATVVKRMTSTTAWTGAVAVLFMVVAACTSSTRPDPRGSGAGTTWSELRTQPSPPPRSAGGFALHRVSGSVVLFGGVGPAARDGYGSDDTWTWDGKAWVEQDPPTRPVGRNSQAMAEAPDGQVVMFGGCCDDGSGGGVHDGPLADTWTWDGRDWTDRQPAVRPDARVAATVAYDGATRTDVLFGGSGIGGDLGDTWTWDGREWSRRSPPHSPPARSVAAMAYDVGTRRVVLFGGSGKGGYLGDTWTWDGREWTRQSPATSPPARAFPTMSYDPALGRVVMMGGTSAAGYLNDTWTWDGRTWARLSSDSAPSNRASTAAAPNPGSESLVLFGGFSGEERLGDTWILGESGSQGKGQ